MKLLATALLVLFTFTASADPEGPSADNRKDKTWGATAMLGNFTGGFTSEVGKGLGASYFITSKDLISVEVGWSSNYDFLTSLVGNSVSSHSFWSGVYYKRFLTNSFYVKGGFEYMREHYSVDHTGLGLAQDYVQTANTDIYSVTVGIGNEWQFQTVTIGCDWISVVQPLALGNYSEGDSGTGNSGWNLRERFRRTGDELLRFHIGAAF